MQYMLIFKGFGFFSHGTGFKKKVRLYALILAVSHTVPVSFLELLLLYNRQR